MISSWPYAPKLFLYLPLSSHADSPVCPLIYLSMQEIFTQQLLYASYCSRHLEGSAEKTDTPSVLKEIYILEIS